MTLEMGKSLAESKAEIVYAAEFFRWFSGEAVRIDGQLQAVRERHQPRARDEAAGRAEPDDHALELPDGDGHAQDRPGVAAGCTMVVKPAKQTPLSMLALAEILEEAGLPGGVFNVVTSSSSGSVMEPLIKDPRLRKLSFTGSTEVGSKLIEASAQHAEGVDGARRQRAVPGLRGRRPRRRRRGRDAREDAQHRRGLHVGQPLPRGRAGAEEFAGSWRRRWARSSSGAAPRRTWTSGR